MAEQTANKPAAEAPEAKAPEPAKLAIKVIEGQYGTHAAIPTIDVYLDDKLVLANLSYSHNYMPVVDKEVMEKVFLIPPRVWKTKNLRDVVYDIGCLIRDMVWYPGVQHLPAQLTQERIYNYVRAYRSPKEKTGLMLYFEQTQKERQLVSRALDKAMKEGGGKTTTTAIRRKILDEQEADAQPKKRKKKAAPTRKKGRTRKRMKKR